MVPGDRLLSGALLLLRRAEVRVVSGGPADLDLVVPGGGAVAVKVKVYGRPPTPSIVEGLRRGCREDRFLLVTPHATSYLGDLAAEGVVDLIAVEEGRVVIGGVDHTAASTEAGSGDRALRRGRRPWTRWAVERLLLLAEQPLTQVELAAVLRVTQQSVSHVLRGHRFASRTDRGWVIGQRAEVLDGLLGEYPGPGGVSTYWYGLDPAVRQAEAAATWCAESNVGCVLTGDVAADVYAPWRLPAVAGLYSRELLDFTAAGFTPATDAEYTLVVTVPQDGTLWRTAAAAAQPTARVDPAAVDAVPPVRVDPIIALRDVLASAGPDAAEAAEQLRRTILDGTWRG
ncbi:hypothetical protein [Rhodococcus opacus]|uniref:hypothetical protein n=1 Tax=Rhodococcus opacus TaxID=37919 RepID=UPI0010574627|nr:hypothetical protein [Rhodococcus opacus]